MTRTMTWYISRNLPLQASGSWPAARCAQLDGPVGCWLVQYGKQHSLNILLVGGYWNMTFIFPFSWEWNNHPNWWTHIFQMVKSTTNQSIFDQLWIIHRINYGCWLFFPEVREGRLALATPHRFTRRLQGVRWAVTGGWKGCEGWMLLYY